MSCLLIFLSLSLFKRGPVIVSYLYIHVDHLSLSLFKRGSVVVAYLYIHVAFYI